MQSVSVLKTCGTIIVHVLFMVKGLAVCRKVIYCKINLRDCFTDCIYKYDNFRKFKMSFDLERERERERDRETEREINILEGLKCNLI